MADGTAPPSMLPQRHELMGLPNEVLLHIAGFLDQRTLSRWMRASGFSYQLLVRLLYRNDIAATRDPVAGCRSLRWGCRAGIVRTVKRAIEAGIDPNCPCALPMAVDGEAPLDTVAALLDSGASANQLPFRRVEDPCSRATFWPVLDLVLDASSQAPRWCPVPVVQCFLEHDAVLGLGTESGSGSGSGSGFGSGSPGGDQVHSAMRVWERVMAMPQVRGPRRKRVVGQCTTTTASADDDFVLRYDHCLHPEPCCVALTQLLLKHGADPSLRCRDETLVLLAMCDHRRPTELLRCLVDAGASLAGDLDNTMTATAAAAAPVPALTPSSSSSSSLSSPSPRSRASPRSPPPEGRTPLQLALEDVIRIQSLRRYPRGRNWSCYPEVRCPRAHVVVEYLLAHGVPISKRSRTLLDKWDGRWRRFAARRDGGLANRSV